MRIVIDLQAAQSTGSRTRGIGRYSIALAKAMLRNRSNHEIIIALNGLFPETIAPIKAEFSGLLPSDNILVWQAPPDVSFLEKDNDWRRKAAELIREAFLAELNPDVVHVSSLFEGAGDDAVTSISRISRNYFTAVTLYDLIPYIHRSPYLDDPGVKSWYMEKISYLKKADLLLAISDSSRAEAIDYLGVLPEKVCNISGDADEQFVKHVIGASEKQSVFSRYGISKPFVMYTGGIDFRKNVEGLIQAYAKMPVSVRAQHQLAVVCSVNPEVKESLLQLAVREGLKEHEVLFTGYVPENDLVDLYNLCALFVFPSWHEGFGLPVLEAMRCGAPVIGANTSCLPEIIGTQDALFDPYCVTSIANLMMRGLTDLEFRKKLTDHGHLQAARFSWDISAQAAITAIEKCVAERVCDKLAARSDSIRLKLAYVSPVPPERSGIADYSAELIPYLSQFYDIDVIVDQDSLVAPWSSNGCVVRSINWFLAHSDTFDRVVYHFGNSDFHKHMFGLLERVPGVVVLHDFFLSGALNYMQATFGDPLWHKELYVSHGYQALLASERSENIEYSVFDYPCNFSVIDNSVGLICHSKESLRLSESWYGENWSQKWREIPLCRGSAIVCSRDEARNSLGFADDDFIVASFGGLYLTKLNHRLIQSWFKSTLATNKKCHLIFVGDIAPCEYKEQLENLISENPSLSTIRITGWVDEVGYSQYLAASDFAVQLRTLSRGETSAAVLDCMKYGLPTIVNENGSMADLDESAVFRIPDNFSDSQLIGALESLFRDCGKRDSIGQAARMIVEQAHTPSKCSKQYFDAIEAFYLDYEHDNATTVLHEILKQEEGIPKSSDLAKVSNCLVQLFPPKFKQHQVLLDVSFLVSGLGSRRESIAATSVVKELLLGAMRGTRIEPVYFSQEGEFRYARIFTRKLLELGSDFFVDDLVDVGVDDVFIGLNPNPEAYSEMGYVFETLRAKACAIKFMVYDFSHIFGKNNLKLKSGLSSSLELLLSSDGIVCISAAVKNAVMKGIEQFSRNLDEPFSVEVAYWRELNSGCELKVSARGHSMAFSES